MATQFLPIGSVVQLNNSGGLVMIAGYLPIEPSHPNYMWDYSGFRFPLGFDSTDNIYCFNHDQIEVVYAYGYRDIEHDGFIQRLQAARETLEEEIRNNSAGGSAPDADKPESDAPNRNEEGS